jgi:DNA (cytosine-5)-methyltransferase 1
VLKNYTGAIGQPVDQSLGTITGIDHHSLFAGNLSKFYGTAKHGAVLDEPAPTITAGGEKGGGHLGLQSATLIHYYGSGGQDQSVQDPIHAIVGKDRHALVTGVLGDDLAGAIRCAEFLVEYGGYVPQSWAEVDGRQRPVVVININGALYLLTDLGLRMLQPEELKLAQGFEADYILLGTKADQVKAIGNSVPPHVAEAMVRANFLEGEEDYAMEAVA